MENLGILDSSDLLQLVDQQVTLMTEIEGHLHETSPPLNPDAAALAYLNLINDGMSSTNKAF